MKKLLCLLFVLTLLGALTVPALADVIWEPENSFWRTHQAECEYVYGRQYEAQTNAAAYTDPERQTAAGGTIPVGDLRSFQWIWTDKTGGEWGYSNWDDGWLRLSDFRRLYTESVFYEEHTAVIADETGALPFSADRAFISYTFPGSGETSTRFGGRDSAGAADPNFRYDRTYTDEAGLKWGAATYSGRYHFWVCLSDPYNDALPRTAPKYADESPVLQRGGIGLVPSVEIGGPVPIELPPGEKPPLEAAAVGEQTVSDGETAPAVPTPVEPTPAPVSPTQTDAAADGPAGTEQYEIFEATVGNDAPPTPADASQIEHPGTPGEIGVSPAPAAPEAVAPKQVLHTGLIAGLVAAAVAASAALLLILRRKKTK